VAAAAFASVAVLPVPLTTVVLVTILFVVVAAAAEELHTGQPSINDPQTLVSTPCGSHGENGAFVGSSSNSCRYWTLDTDLHTKADGTFHSGNLIGI